VKPHPEPLDIPKGQGKKIKEKGSLGLCGQRDKFTLLLRGCPPVDILEISGLSTEARPIINDLAVDLTGGVINKRHGNLPT